MKHPSDVLRAGQIVVAKLLKSEEDRDSGKLRISLSLKQAGGDSDPWLNVVTKYSVGTQHKGTVDKKENFGIFISLEPGVSGLLPRSKWRDALDAQQYETKKRGDEIYIRVDQIEFESKRMTFSLPLDSVDDSWKEHSGSTSFGTLGDLFKGLKK